MPAAESGGCCSPLSAAALTNDEAASLARAFAALADPARLRLLSLIATSDTGEVCACDLVAPWARASRP
jgi:ArsR family transcriptional regulator